MIVLPLYGINMNYEIVLFKIKSNLSSVKVVLVTPEDSLLKEEEEELGCGAILFCEIKGSIKSQNCSIGQRQSCQLD